ncbi:MAG: thiol-disulfide oxidoreductase DCC family protein [Planctomycetota bacterium]
MATSEPVHHPVGEVASAPAVLVFDDECGLCTRSMRWLQRHARRGARLELVGRSTPGAARWMAEDGVSPALVSARVDSVVLLTGGRVFLRSSAVLRLLPHLRWPWRVFGMLWLVPRPLRDSAYDFVARRRHSWFGRGGGGGASCPLGDSARGDRGSDNRAGSPTVVAPKTTAGPGAA